jgi:hypothetical protein
MRRARRLGCGARARQSRRACTCGLPRASPAGVCVCTCLCVCLFACVFVCLWAAAGAVRAFACEVTLRSAHVRFVVRLVVCLFVCLSPFLRSLSAMIRGSRAERLDMCHQFFTRCDCLYPYCGYPYPCCGYPYP